MSMRRPCSGIGGSIEMAPEIPARDRAEWAPWLADRFELPGLRQCVEPVEEHCGLAHAVVAHGQDVGAAETRDQQHVRGPFANAANLRQSLDHLRIVEPAQTAWVEAPLGEGLGHAAHGGSLLAGQARLTEARLGQGAERGGRGDAAAAERAHSALDGARRGARDLLMENRAHERPVGVASLHELARADPADHGAEPRIAAGKMTRGVAQRRGIEERSHRGRTVPPAPLGRGAARANGGLSAVDSCPMTDHDLRKERTQNLWASVERKLPLLSRATSLDPDPRTTFEEIGGLASAKDELETYACAATHPDVYARWGTFPPTGLLLIGQRGVGKTLLASALAARTQTGFLRITVPRLVIELLHSGGKAAELVGGWAQALVELPPITVFFEELEFLQTEEIGARRADLPQGPIMDFLLDLIDRTIEASSTLVIASTSHPETLRRAFVMSGRFERIVEVNPIVPDDVAAALALHARDAEKRAGRPLFGSVDWMDVVRQFREPSTGDWIRLLHATLRRKARCEAAGELVTPVSTQDVQEEVERSRRARRQLPVDGGGIYL